MFHTVKALGFLIIIMRFGIIVNILPVIHALQSFATEGAISIIGIIFSIALFDALIVNDISTDLTPA